MKQRRFRPLFLIDIAVPRDLDPEINKLDNVFLYDIDDLEGVIAANLEERKKEAEKISVLLEEELVAFKQWQTERAAIPLIQAVQQKAGAIQQSVMESLQNKIPNLSERDIWQLEKHTTSLINQMLREPITQIKEMALEPQAEFYLKAFSRIFGLDAASVQSKTDTSPHPEENRTGQPDANKEKNLETVSTTNSSGKNYKTANHASVETRWLGGLSR
jgi:glutamyl-tRNA reductase